MKLLLGSLIILIISSLSAMVTVKVLRKNIDGQFVYRQDPYVTWAGAFWGLIYFLTQFFGDDFNVGKEFRSLRILSILLFFVLLFVSLRATYRRIIVSPLNIIEKSFLTKDRVFNRHNLLNISTFRYKGKNFLSFHLTNGKNVLFYEKHIDINDFYKRFKVYEEYKKQVDSLPGPLFDEEISSDYLVEFNQLACEKDRIEYHMISQFEEVIMAGDNLIFYDAQAALRVIGMLIADQSPDWSCYNLPSHPKFEIMRESPVYEYAFKALKTIKETDNEWVELTNETGFLYYTFEVEQMYE